MIAFACMMYATLGVSAQFVDITTKDVQAGTNKAKAIQKEKPIDKTIRPKGFIGGVGYELEIIPISVRPDNFPEVKKTEFMHGPNIELGYQITPQFGLTVEGTFGFEIAPLNYVVDEDNKYGHKYGVMLNSYYYFSPRLAEGLYVSAGVGYFNRLMFSYAVRIFDSYNNRGWRYAFCANGGDLKSSIPLKVKAGYAWKNMKVEGSIEFARHEYMYYEWLNYQLENVYDITEKKLEVICGLKASCYFNAGYRKFLK